MIVMHRWVKHGDAHSWMISMIYTLCDVFRAGEDGILGWDIDSRGVA